MAVLALGCPRDEGSAFGTSGEADASTGDAPTLSTSSGEPSDPIGGPGVCELSCDDADACRVGGTQVGLCSRDVCSFPGTYCTSDVGCMAFLSGWEDPCTTTAACERPGTACIEIEAGLGRCATVGDPESCSPEMLDAFSTQDIDGAAVVVCAVADAVCDDDGACVDPCQSDAHCSGPAFPTCNLARQRCVCETDAHCESLGAPETSACIDGRCGCDDDQDCVGAQTPANVCIDGRCMCSDASVCADMLNPFDGAIPTCVPR